MIYFDFIRSGAVITAALNALYPLVRSRAQYVVPIVQSLIAWNKSIPPHLKPLEIKSIERTIRNELLALLRCAFFDLVLPVED
jgi:hypothetical protein